MNWHNGLVFLAGCSFILLAIALVGWVGATDSKGSSSRWIALTITAAVLFTALGFLAAVGAK